MNAFGSLERGWWLRFALGAMIFASVMAVAIARLSDVGYEPTALAGLPSPDIWDRIRVDGAHKTYGSLEAMAGDASVVVIGRFTSVAKGRVFSPEPEYGDRGAAFYLDGSFLVEEVLRGSLADANSLSITVELFVGGPVDPSTVPVPIERQILFLINKAQHPTNAHLTAADRADEAKYYEILGGQEQGRMTLRGDTVEVSSAISSSEFPWELMGMDASLVIESIRNLQ